MTPDNISFELTLFELASGARVNQVRAPNGPRNSGGSAAQFIVEPVGKPCFGSRDLGKQDLKLPIWSWV